MHCGVQLTRHHKWSRHRLTSDRLWAPPTGVRAHAPQPAAGSADRAAAGAAGVCIQARHAPCHDPLARVQPGGGAAGAAVRGLGPRHRAPVPAGGARAVRRLRRPRSRVSWVWACSLLQVRALSGGPQVRRALQLPSVVNAVVTRLALLTPYIHVCSERPCLLRHLLLYVVAELAWRLLKAGDPCLPAALPAAPADLGSSGAGRRLWRQPPGSWPRSCRSGRPSATLWTSALLRHAAAALPGTAPSAQHPRARAHFGHL
jgi:hypothetical protein